MTTKEKIAISLKSTNRAGIENLLQCMEKSGFYDAPCSSKYHLSNRGGLAEHSLNVMQYALAAADAFYFRQGEQMPYRFLDSVIICALLHDLGKMGQFGKPNYIPDSESGAFKANEKLLYVSHEIRSVVIASRYIELTEEEQFAILYHNGLYGELKSFKGNEIPLYLIIHYADMWAARVVEK